VFAVVRETTQPGRQVSYQQETRIILDRKVESISSDVSGHALAGVISAPRDAHARRRPTGDKTLDACADVTLRDHGGVYWAPAPYAELIREDLVCDS
jgi:hypothetical protein